MLMQESRKKVIDIHKCNFFSLFFFMRACRPICTGYELMWVGPLRAYRSTILAYPASFLQAYESARRARPTLPPILFLEHPLASYHFLVTY